MISEDTKPKQQHIVTGARNIPQSKPLRLRDLRTGQTLVSRPAQSLNDLTDEITACIPDQTDQPVIVHDPSLTQDQIAVPCKLSSADGAEPASAKSKKRKAQKRGDKKPKQKAVTQRHEKIMHDSRPSDTVPPERIQQLVSNQGPVFVLTPVDDVSSPQKGLQGSAPGGGAGPPPADFVISPVTKPLQRPVVTGARSVPLTDPLIVTEPRTGQTLVARPAQNLKDLREKVTACIPDDDSQQPMRIHDPVKQYDQIAYPAEPNSVDETVSAQKVGRVEKPFAERLKDPTVRSEPDSVDSAPMKKDEPMLQQIITEKGPAYVLKPVGSVASPQEGIQGDALMEARNNHLLEITTSSRKLTHRDCLWQLVRGLCQNKSH